MKALRSAQTVSSAMAIACSLLLTLVSCGHAEAQSTTTPLWGVLHTTYDPLPATINGTNYDLNSTQYIQQAELLQSSTEDNSNPATGSPTCSNTAAAFVQAAIAAFERWKDVGDSENGINLMEIEVQWGLYQPNYTFSTEHPGLLVNDICYQQFLQQIIRDYRNDTKHFQIVINLGFKDGPTWLTNSTDCPNCLYQGYFYPASGSPSLLSPQENPVTPPDPAGTNLLLPNMVFNQNVRNLANAFIQSAMPLAQSAGLISYVRVGLSQHGETGYPPPLNSVGVPAYQDVWWAADPDAQFHGTGTNPRPTTIPNVPDCLYGWYPGQTLPTCAVGVVSADQAVRDWWSWYFDAGADALAYVIYELREASYSGTILLVTPGVGVLPDKLIGNLNNIAAGSWSTYNTNNPNEDELVGAAHWILYDQIVYQLNNHYRPSSLGTIQIDVSSVAMDANPSASGSTYNPEALCNHNGTDSSGQITTNIDSTGISPNPSTNFNIGTIGAPFFGLVGFPDSYDKWSSVRQLTYINTVSDLPNGGNPGVPAMISENPGENAASGTLSGGKWKTGMNDVMNLMHSCSSTALLWAFDNELNTNSGDAQASDYGVCIADWEGVPPNYTCN